MLLASPPLSKAPLHAIRPYPRTPSIPYHPPMPTRHAPNRKPRKRPRNPGGAPRGNQNARKHGRYSKLRPADRPAFIRKTLRSYGAQDTATLLGVPYADLAAQSDTVLTLLRMLLRASEQIAQANAEINAYRRNGPAPR